MSGRENAVTKAHRLLAEARLTVERVDGSSIVATCRGDGDVHRLGYERGVWRCSCPARGRCSHLLALGLVVVRPAGR